MSECAKCGKELTIQVEGKAGVGKFEGMKTVGLHIGVSWGAVTVPEVAEHIKAQLGKHAPTDDATEVNFDFCLECYLDSMMFSNPSPRGYVDITTVGDEKPRYLILPGFTKEKQNAARRIIEAANQEREIVEE